MPLTELGADIAAIRAAHCHATSELPDTWTPDRPSTGQCHVTALLLHERHGGQILSGVCRDNPWITHFWNVIDGTTIDATRDQFPDDVEISDVNDVTGMTCFDVTRAKADLLRTLAFGENQ